MYSIRFYLNEKGESDVKAFILELREKSLHSKDARINYHKVIAYIRVLRKYGNIKGMPIMRHLDNDIWELRPLDNRILYASCKDDTFILLHHFIKKTRRTPKREIEKAEHELEDFRRRND